MLAVAADVVVLVQVVAVVSAVVVHWLNGHYNRARGVVVAEQSE